MSHQQPGLFLLTDRDDYESLYRMYFFFALYLTQKGNRMRYEIFRHWFLPKKIINTREVCLVFPEFDRRRLFEWQRKGHIRKIINGYYVFSEIDIDEWLLMRLAKVMYAHSYISLETALRYYGLIPEAVYQITSCSTGKTKLFNTPVASFRYRSCSPKWFFG